MTLAFIMAWYVIIGALATLGSIYLTHKFVPVRHEATVYGSFLTLIAAFYLVCTSHFGNEAAWPLESAAVLAFALMGCLGTRLPVVLIAGYALHGGWDLLHEVQAHVHVDVFAGREATKIPLAYGAFCATFDWAIAAYFLYRRPHWVAAWKPRG